MHSIKHAVLWMESGAPLLFSMSMCGFRIYDKKTSVQMDYQMFSIKGPAIYVQETMKTRLWPWDIRAFPLCEGWAGKRGPLSVHPSSQHKWKGGPCAEGISRKCVCVWERPERLEAPWIEREAFFFLNVIPWSSLESKAGPPLSQPF